MNYQESMIKNSANIWRQFGESYSKNHCSIREEPEAVKVVSGTDAESPKSNDYKPI